jgi:hypothetical protein
MKKKLFGLASLLCAATLCVSGGVALLNDNAQPVVAETATATNQWTNDSGVTYTFANDLGGEEYYQLGNWLNNSAMKTKQGLTAPSGTHQNYAGASGDGKAMLAEYNSTKTALQYTGFQFEFKTDNEWIRPASADGTQTESCWGQINLWYGDLTIYMQRRGTTNHLTFVIESYGLNASNKRAKNGTLQAQKAVVIENFFVTNEDGYDVMADWAQVRISKNACTAISDGSAAVGYWMHMEVKAPQADTYTVVYDAYVPYAMTDSSNDNIAISNATTLGIQTSLDAKDDKFDNHYCNLTLRDFADWQDTVCMDVADFNADYAFGVTGMSAQRMKENDWDLQTKTGKDSIGIEFRYKADATSLAAARDAYIDSKTTAPTYIDTILSVHLGTRVFEIDWNYNKNQSRLSTRDISKGWSGQEKNSTAANKYGTGNPAFNPLENEYYFRVLRVRDNSRNVYAYYFYMAAVKADGSLDKEACLLNAYEDIIREPKYDNASYNKISVQPLCVANSTSYPYTATISSNKYVGIKTSVDGVETVEKVARGSNYTLANLTEGTTVHAGWSKGAETYSEEDFVAAGTVLENVQEPASYTALTMTLEADKAASIRFRQRTVAGEVLPLEISLKWNVKANDSSNVGYYFGGIKFGYVLTADNGKTSGDVEVNNVTDGFTTPYEYGVIQSNIGEASYDMKFTCQAYVELSGVKYYTAAADMENDGRSVDIVADAATADLQSVETNGEYVHPTYGVQYSNAIKDAEGNVIGYHYLTQEQYDLVAKASAVNA